MFRFFRNVVTVSLAVALLTSGCAVLSGCGKDADKSKDEVSSVESQSPAFFDMLYDEPADYEKTEDKQESDPSVGEYTLRTYKFNGYYLAMYYFKDNEIDKVIGADNLSYYEEKDINGQTFKVEKNRRDTVGYAYCQHGSDVYVVLYMDILYDNDDTATIHENYDALLKSVHFAS